MQVMRVAQGTHARDVTSTTKPTRLSDVHTFVKVAGIAQTSCLLQERKGSFLGSAVHTTCRIPEGKATTPVVKLSKHRNRQDSS